MPAGDLITADFQVELNGYLMGGADNPLGPGPITGLGIPAAKTADVDLDGTHGAYGSSEWMSTRVITVPFELNGDDASDAMDMLIDANVAWAPIEDGNPVELHVRVPGWGHFHVVGRPRLLDVDLTLMPFGTIFCLGTFAALDPTMVSLGLS